MYKLGSFQKRDNLPYWLFFIFKKINRVGQIWTRVGQIWTVSELPLRNVADLKKIIKICGAYNKKHCVKKLWKYIYICGRYGRKSNFAPPWKKNWKFNVLFCPTYFFWYCSNLPHGLHHFFISVQPHSIGRATDFFFLTFWKKLFFSCNFLGYLGPKTHFKQLFFSMIFKK